MKKKIILVEPGTGSANVFSFVNYLPLLGPLYLATTLKKAGFAVTVLNENILKRRINASELSADILLLSCLTPTVTRGFEIAKEFKSLNPNGKVIIGGPHVTFVRDEELECIDHVVNGEGENIIIDLIENGSTEKFITGTPIKDMDSLPMIDWSVLKGYKKACLPAGRGSIMPIMTSRGCPFACNFCSVTEMFGRGYRAMSPERVLDEYSRIEKPSAFFYDDNFTANRKRAHDIMDGIIRLKKKPRDWCAQVRSDVAKDPELVEKMARSGCDRVFIGFESINPSTLKTLKKSQTPEDIENAITVLHKNKIKVHGMFMYGSDSDGPEVVKETIKFVKRCNVDSVQYMVLTPLPGTYLFKRLESENRLIHRDWRYYDGLHVVFWPEKFTPAGLQEYALEAFEKFYSLTSAANEIINLMTDEVSSFACAMANKSRLKTHSLKTAMFKAGGKVLLGRWHKLNKTYLAYLSQISTMKVIR